MILFVNTHSPDLVKDALPPDARRFASHLAGLSRYRTRNRESLCVGTGVSDTGTGPGCEKEKGRLLAPPLQSRKETACRAFSRVTGRSWPQQVSPVSPWFVLRCPSKRCLTGPRHANTGSDLA